MPAGNHADDADARRKPPRRGSPRESKPSGQTATQPHSAGSERPNTDPMERMQHNAPEMTPVRHAETRHTTPPEALLFSARSAAALARGCVLPRSPALAPSRYRASRLRPARSAWVASGSRVLRVSAAHSRFASCPRPGVAPGFRGSLAFRLVTPSARRSRSAGKVLRTPGVASAVVPCTWQEGRRHDPAGTVLPPMLLAVCRRSFSLA